MLGLRTILRLGSGFGSNRASRRRNCADAMLSQGGLRLLPPLAQALEVERKTFVPRAANECPATPLILALELAIGIVAAKVEVLPVFRRPAHSPREPATPSLIDLLRPECAARVAVASWIATRLCLALATLQPRLANFERVLQRVSRRLPAKPPMRPFGLAPKIARNATAKLCGTFDLTDGFTPIIAAGSTTRPARLAAVQSSRACIVFRRQIGITALHAKVAMDGLIRAPTVTGDTAAERCGTARHLHRCLCIRTAGIASRNLLLALEQIVSPALGLPAALAGPSIETPAVVSSLVVVPARIASKPTLIIRIAAKLPHSLACVGLAFVVAATTDIEAFGEIALACLHNV